MSNFSPEFKILGGQNPEFKILEGQNPDSRFLRFNRRLLKMNRRAWHYTKKIHRRARYCDK